MDTDHILAYWLQFEFFLKSKIKNSPYSDFASKVMK